MPRALLIDEFQLSFFVPRKLPDAAYAAIRQSLDRPHFQAELRRVVRALVRQDPALDRVTVQVSR